MLAAGVLLRFPRGTGVCVVQAGKPCAATALILSVDPDEGESSLGWAALQDISILDEDAAHSIKAMPVLSSRKAGRSATTLDAYKDSSACVPVSYLVPRNPGKTYRVSFLHCPPHSN